MSRSGDKVTGENYIGRIAKASLSSILLLSLVHVRCCPVRTGQNILLFEQLHFLKMPKIPIFMGSFLVLLV